MLVMHEIRRFLISSIFQIFYKFPISAKILNRVILVKNLE